MRPRVLPRSFYSRPTVEVARGLLGQWLVHGDLRGRISEVEALTPGATVTLNCALGDVFTLTPAEAESINATNLAAGQRVNVIVTTSGTNSYTLTFNTNFKTTGTLATGTSTGKVFVVAFVSDGTNLNEVARTTAM